MLVVALILSHGHYGGISFSSWSVFIQVTIESWRSLESELRGDLKKGVCQSVCDTNKMISHS